MGREIKGEGLIREREGERHDKRGKEGDAGGQRNPEEREAVRAIE